jgi:hypothetical protein
MAKAKEYEEDVCFSYPENLGEIELASLVMMYRNRGEVIKATPSSFFCCCLQNVLIKQAKNWFGKTYSQEAWDRMLTPSSEGYPLTIYEMHLLGYAGLKQPDASPYSLNFIELNIQLPSAFCFVLINDLKAFGFLEDHTEAYLTLTDRGEKALNGISRRIFKKRYVQDFLPHISGSLWPENSSRSSTKSSKGRSQASLF